MKSSDKTLSDWIKLNSFYELRKKDSLGTILGFLILLVGAIFLSFSAALLFMLLATITGYGPYQPDQDASALRNLGLIAVGIFGAPFIVWRSWVAHQQVNISEQNQITDRITKAVEGLGAERTVKEIIEGFSASDVGFNERFIELTKPNIEVRIGSIYSLERISKDSSRDHIQIMEILCAYIRQNSGTQGNLDERELKLRPVPRSDVQAAINVIGRRSQSNIDIEASKKFRLDLRNSDLSGIDFRDGHFAGAMFHECRIEAAIFDHANLSGGQFFNSILNYSSFRDANLTGARMDWVKINRPKVTLGGMSESITYANCYGLCLRGADISQITYLGEADKTNFILGTIDTKVNGFLKHKVDNSIKLQESIFSQKMDGNSSEANALNEKLEAAGFKSWFGYNSDDLAFGPHYRDFIETLDLGYWPYVSSDKL